MTSKVTSVEVISFAKITTALTRSWPPSLEASKFQVLLFHVSWYASCINNILLVLPLLNSLYQDREDPVILCKSVNMCCATIQTAVKMMMCRLQYSRFQILCYELENFCKQADDQENLTLQRYIDNYKRIYGIYILWCYITAIGVISGPLYLNDHFPTAAKYPFSVSHNPVKSIIYLQQSLAGLQAASALSIDCIIAIFLLFCAARLDILASKIRSATTEREIDACIQLHNEILKYTAEVIRVIRPLVLATITTTGIAIIFGGMNMINDQPIIVKAQYFVVFASSAVELYMNAFPADHLMHTSNKICFAAYESQWFLGSVSMQRKILQIIFRSQKPEIISINGIVPDLSLRYYGGFLYTSCSYFTAVRIMISENPPE